MTVECPRCGTRYRRPTEAGHGTFRCARCRHVFEARRDEPAFVADDEATAIEDDREEDFILDDPLEADDPAPRRRTAAARPAARAEEVPHVMTPPRFALRALLLVTLAYGLLSAWLLADSVRARRVLRHVPLIGSRLADPRLDPAAVTLSSVRGEYQRVRGDHLVFVVTGAATNASSVPVRGIQVQAFAAGGETQRQVVFCGAAPRTVHDLSLREIALLQTIEPPRDWTLGPGEETSFLVVFPAPPPDLREFGAEVVAVRAPKAPA